MASMLISIESSELDIATLRHQFDRTPNRRMTLKRIVRYMQAALSGAKPAYMNVALASAHASATVTCDQSAAVNGTDACVIAGTSLEIEASPVDQDDFLLGATDAAFATNLAAAINAHTTLSKIVRASAEDDVVTITCKVPGPIGNLVTLSEVGNGLTVSGAALANGASDEMDALPFGYDPTV